MLKAQATAESRPYPFRFKREQERWVYVIKVLSGFETLFFTITYLASLDSLEPANGPWGAAALALTYPQDPTPGRDVSLG